MSPTPRSATEAEIRAVIDGWAEATRNQDLDAIMAYHAPEVRTFDCHSVVQFRGAESYRAFYAACLAHMQGKMDFDIGDLDIAAGGDLAVAHFIATCGATGLDGSRHESRLRATLCLERRDGGWRITHAHWSAPFDPMTGKAMFGDDAGALAAPDSECGR